MGSLTLLQSPLHPIRDNVSNMRIGRVAPGLKLSQYFPTNFWKRVQKPLLISKPHPSLWLLLSHGLSCCCNLCWPWPRKHNPELLQLLKMVVPNPASWRVGCHGSGKHRGRSVTARMEGGTHPHVVIVLQHPGDPDRCVFVLCFLCCWTLGTKVWAVGASVHDTVHECARAHPFLTFLIYSFYYQS